MTTSILLTHAPTVEVPCNRGSQSVKIDASLVDVLVAVDTILKEHTDTFLESRNHLTAKQWNHLFAIAKEGGVAGPTSSAFHQKYHLGAPSTVSRLLNALFEKDLILETKMLESSSCCVYNVFFQVAGEILTSHGRRTST